MSTPKPTIVVGLDGSEVAAEALDWAMAEGEYRGYAVEVISVWRYFEPLPGGTGTSRQVRPHSGLAELAEYIDEHLAAAAERHPGVRYRHRNLGGLPPGETLVQEAEQAEMLVVGSHGTSGVLPALLGSVSAHCVRHAPCPVVIVRSGAGRHMGKRRAAKAVRPAPEATMGPLL